MKPTVQWAKLQVGQSLPELIKQPTYAHLFMFSAATWNRHMIHYNTEYARGDGLEDVAVHRALIGNYLAQVLTHWLGNDGRLRTLEWSVRSSAKPGDRLRCGGRIKEKHQVGDELIVVCELSVAQEDGQLVAPGTAEIQLYA